MKLQEKINKDFIQAKKERQNLAAQVLTMVRSALKNKEIEKKKELKDEDVIAVIKIEVKQRQDAAEQYKKGGRPELAEKETKEITLLQEYLPEQMDSAAIEKIVVKAMADTGASSPADMGKVMAKVMSELKGKADGATVQKIVRAKLA